MNSNDSGRTACPHYWWDCPSTTTCHTHGSTYLRSDPSVVRYNTWVEHLAAIRIDAKVNPQAFNIMLDLTMRAVEPQRPDGSYSDVLGLLMAYHCLSVKDIDKSPEEPEVEGFRVDHRVFGDT
jgi:hypothetical protein